MDQEKTGNNQLVISFNFLLGVGALVIFLVMLCVYQLLLNRVSGIADLRATNQSLADSVGNLTKQLKDINDRVAAQEGYDGDYKQNTAWVEAQVSNTELEVAGFMGQNINEPWDLWENYTSSGIGSPTVKQPYKIIASYRTSDDCMRAAYLQISSAKGGSAQTMRIVISNGNPSSFENFRCSPHGLAVNS